MAKKYKKGMSKVAKTLVCNLQCLTISNSSAVEQDWQRTDTRVSQQLFSVRLNLTSKEFMIEYQPDSKNKVERHKICINFKSVNRISIEEPVITLDLTEQYVQSKRESLQVKMKKKFGGSDKMISKPTWVWRELSSQSLPGQLTECPVIHKVCMKLMNSNSKLKVNHFQDFIEQRNTADPQLKTAMEGTA